MKMWSIAVLLLASFGNSGPVMAGTDGTNGVEIQNALGSDVVQAIMTLRLNPVVRKALSGADAVEEAPPAVGNPLSDFATVLPHATQPDMSRLEKSLLTAYLNNPSSVPLAEFLAIQHLSAAMLSAQSGAGQGKILQHKIIAQYFLSRAKDLGALDPWIMRSIAKTQQDLDSVFHRAGTITLDENRDAHLFFRDTFHFREANRYIATDKLLDEFASDPNNVYTTFAATAVNLWVGSEGDYADPTVLYNFVVGSYLSLHTMKLASNLETAWDNDPVHNTRFRMATLLGGFSLLQRRWLAKMHGDPQAVNLIDDEHRQWRLIHRAFHAFTLGLPFFEEPEHFQEGKFAFEDGIAHCQEQPVRTCSDLPRFPFNFLSFMLGYADFLLKNGDTQAATQVLAYRSMPQLADTYNDWDLGRAAYEHRENNAAAISALYQDGNLNDAPLNFFMKKRKWGMNTTTCQVCHQVQSTVWTTEQMNAIQLPPESEASVHVWPKVATTWYGGVIQ